MKTEMEEQPKEYVEEDKYDIIAEKNREKKRKK